MDAFAVVYPCYKCVYDHVKICHKFAEGKRPLFQSQCSVNETKRPNGNVDSSVRVYLSRLSKNTVILSFSYHRWRKLIYGTMRKSTCWQKMVEIYIRIIRELHLQQKCQLTMKKNHLKP